MKKLFTTMAALGVSALTAFNLAAASALSVTYTKTDVSCNGGKNGSIDVSVSGGTSPYTYAWSNGASTQDLSNLAAGSYTVTVKDAASKQLSKTITVGQPNAVTATTLVVNENCYGGSTGSIGIVASGGSGGYTYLWSTGSTAKSIGSLTKGTYSYTVTDIKSCSVSGKATITEPTQVVVSGVVTDIKCNGDANGSVDVSVSGGTSPYSYTWSNGSTTQDLNSLSVGGTYGLSVVDAKACKNTSFYTVSQPSALMLSGNTFDYTCAHDGQVNITVNGGISPYSYKWSNGSSTEDLTSVMNGTYTVTVLDANKCSASSSFTVDSLDPFVVNGQLEMPTCATCTDGLIIPIPTGGVYPYTWLWADGYDNKIHSNLGVGTYTVLMTDSLGCYMYKTYVLTASSAKTSGTLDGDMVNEKIISIYPNPVRDVLNIKLAEFKNEKVDFKLLNSFGELVYSKNMAIETSNLNTSIDLSNLSNGIYFVYICGENSDPIKYQIVKSGK